jgi:hypothetical protein
MGDNEFNQYSSASNRLSASLKLHLLSEAAATYSGLSGLLKSLPIGLLQRLRQTPTVRCTSLAVDLD